jgi:hypothetical protein
MARAFVSTSLLVGILQMASCGGDDTVNPSNPDASASVAKDASSDSHASDAVGDSHASDAASDASATPKDAAGDANAE